jgi:type IV conjugative transfer system coupling protein TraD
MNIDSAYQGHETWWNAFRMSAKMYWFTFKYALAVHLMIFILSCFLFMPQGSLKYTIQYSRYKACSVHEHRSLRDPELDAAFTKMLWRILGIFIASALSYPVVYMFLLGYFKKRAIDQSKPRYVRGALLVSSQELMKAMKANSEVLDLPIGPVKLPREAEVKHTLVIGAPGAGKTNKLSQDIERLKVRKEKMVIYDFKGDYLTKFYDPKKDIIFNPLDKRCLGWNVFNEFTRLMDVDAAAYSLISQSYQQDPFWNDAARDVFCGILYFLYQNNSRTNSDIWAAVTAPIANIAGWLKETKGGERGHVYIQDASSKQAMSVAAVMMQYVKSFEYMSKADGSFCINDWLNDPDAGTIFITNYADVKDTLRPILSLFVDLLGRKLLSMKDDHRRRIFFLLDEFGTLQRLSTIKDLMTLSRSKGGAVCIGIQDKGQIDKIYSPEFSQSILNACGNSVMFRVADPITADYLSKRIGKTEVIETDQTMSMGVADNRDGVSLMQRSREKDLALPSEIMGLRDLEAYLKIANYPITKIDFKYKGYPDKNEPFIIREDLLLDNVVAEQNAIASRARAAGESAGRRSEDGEKKQRSDEKPVSREAEHSHEMDEEMSQ